MLDSRCRLLLGRLDKDADLLFIIRENEANIDANGGRGISVREISTKYENKFGREQWPGRVQDKLRILQDRELVCYELVSGNTKLYKLSRRMCVFLDGFEELVKQLEAGE